MARKDFIKYAEQYRTLARLADYEEKIHINKLTHILPQELRNSIVMLEVERRLPDQWDDYLELLLKAFKALHPDRTKGTIFGTGNGKGKEPDAMNVDTAKKTKGKGKKEANSQSAEKKFCSYCNKHNSRYKNTHNTANCRAKAKDEKSSPSKSSSSPSKDKKGGKQNRMQFKARVNEMQKQLEKLLEEGYDSSDSDPSPSTSTSKTARISTARIEEIPDDDSSSARMETASEGNDSDDESGKWPYSRTPW